LRKMTEQNLRNAFTAESCAHMRYLIFADRAEAENLPNIARLFRAIAYAEQVHASNHFKAIGDIGRTVDNLKTAVAGENFEIEEMYPAYDAIAKLQGELNSVQSIHFAIEAEKPHSALFSEGVQAVKNGKDIEIGAIAICPNCGYTQQVAVQKDCRICCNKKENFNVF